MIQPKPVASTLDLKKIVSVESGDPLIQWKGIWARRQVAQKLENIQKKLKIIDSRYDLLIAEGYRTPEYQERYFLQQFLIEYQKAPSLPLDVLIEKTHAFVALPSVAGHPTGGAVDVTLLWEGIELDMGCKIADFSDPSILPTFSTAISPTQAKNRELLHDLMLSEEFAPFYGEWWHFSYGDREWAVFYNFLETRFSPVLKIPPFQRTPASAL
jgi:D-alanyl-D-alanine dipeptidase